MICGAFQMSRRKCLKTNLKRGSMDCGRFTGSKEDLADKSGEPQVAGIRYSSPLYTMPTNSPPAKAARLDDRA